MNNKNGPEKIVNIRFREDGKIYEYYTGNFVLKKGDRVIVETEKGLNLGIVCSDPKLRDSSMPKRPLRKIFRVATDDDIEQRRNNEETELEAFRFCNERIKKRKLSMNLIETELTFDRKRLVFYYIAAQRVDFRELIKDLVQKFRTHVEMRQIGTRDLAKMVGGIGHCGRRLCCSLFLSDFEPISIRMAKDQELSLNPTKISGVCGRLMCCLSFEHRCYLENRNEPRGDDEPE